MISWNPSVSFSLMKVAELLDLSVAKNDIDFDLERVTTSLTSVMRSLR